MDKLREFFKIDRFAGSVGIELLEASPGSAARPLFAEAKEVSRNFKLVSYTVRVTDDRNDLIAIFQGMVYRKKESNHFVFSDVRKSLAQAAADANFGILFPVPRKSVLNSLVEVLLRMAA